MSPELTAQPKESVVVHTTEIISQRRIKVWLPDEIRTYVNSSIPRYQVDVDETGDVCITTYNQFNPLPERSSLDPLPQQAAAMLPRIVDELMDEKRPTRFAALSIVAIRLLQESGQAGIDSTHRTKLIRDIYDKNAVNKIGEPDNDKGDEIAMEFDNLMQDSNLKLRIVLKAG